MIVERTHDKLYLDEARYENTKECFKVCARLAMLSGALKDGATVADFGCAAGEFAYYLKKVMPTAQIVGYDLLPELIEKARNEVPGVTFEVSSVLDRAALPESHVDIGFLIGVHTIFDDFEPCFSNLIHWCKPGGRLYVFSFFNDHPLDVLVKYRHSTDYGRDVWESGWNIFSQASIGRYLEAHPKVRAHHFHPFEIGLDLAPNPDDPVRSWTVPQIDGRRMITNGLCLVQKQSVLEIEL